MTYIFFCPRCQRRGEVEASGGPAAVDLVVYTAHEALSPGCRMPTRTRLQSGLYGASSVQLTRDELAYMRSLVSGERISKIKTPALELLRRYVESLKWRVVWDYPVDPDAVRGAAMRMLMEMENRERFAVQREHAAVAGEWPEGVA